MLPVISGRKGHVSRNLALSVRYEHDASNHSIDIANRVFAESDCKNMRKLAIHSMYAIPLELITYTGLTHLNFCGLTNADDVMGFIHKLPHLVSLNVYCLILADSQSDFSIPECTEHEPVVPLDTQIKRLIISQVGQELSPEPALSMLKYLLLRISTLRSVIGMIAPIEPIRAFIDEYVQWYPHLANIKLQM
ncbi:hypothetical protein H4R19_000143 [Coemansia spiralis]|nr:hypothetical protein H4R19_000143 [Coemansia spiralis]